MAVAFDAVGPAGGAGASTAGAGPLTWAHINSAAGNAFLVGVNYRAGTSPEATAVTYGGVSLSRLGTVPANNAGPGGIDLWGVIGGLPTGSNTVSVTFTGGAGNFTTAGSVSLTGAASFSAAQTSFANFATSIAYNFTGSTAGGMIVAAASFGNGAAVFATTSPGTQRWSAIGDSSSAADNTVGGTWASPGGTQSIGFSVTVSPSDLWGLTAVEVKAAPIAPPSPVAPLPLKAPGWFPGSAAVTADPGGIPFYAEPAPTDATPAVIVPPTPEAAPAPPQPPGWFPGADRVTAVPGGIPFTPLPPPQTVTPAVVFPVPEVAGEVQWLPWPPNYFPGSQAVSVDPGGIPFYSQPQPLTPPPAPQAPPVISGLGGGATGWFADQYGNPRFLMADNPWGLIPNAGRWGGTWQTDIDTYCSNRGGQGYTAIYLDPLGNTENNGVFADGRTQDGVFPFTVNGSPASTASLSGSETIGLNGPFWARVDYFLSACARNAMAGMLNVAYEGPGDFAAGGAFASMTSAQFGQYGAALGGRYAAVANIIWVVGNDYFGGTGGTIGSGGGTPAGDDTKFSSLLSGLRGAGDAHAITIHNFAESNSREDLGLGTAGTVLQWGNNNAQFNGTYTYNVTYLGIEASYGEPSPIPVMLLDGYFYQGSAVYAGGSGAGAYDRAFRQDTWHAISSGARGVSQGSESIWQWPAAALASSGTDWFHVNNAGNIRTLVESLAGWHRLIPDTGSALVTAGRGTRATAFASGGGHGQYEVGFTDSYVTASRTPDGSMAMVYLSHGTTITIDQTKLGAGYTATWVDPVSCATSAATTGATYNSTAKGNNSQGDPDWVLVFQGPPVQPPAPAATQITALAPGWFPGSERVTAEPGGVPFYVVPQPTDQVASAGITTIATASLAGAAAVAAVVTEAPIATAAGAGSVAAVVTEIAGSAAAGAGAVTAVVTEIAGASLAGAGSVTDVATQAVTASLAGAGAVTDVVTQAVIATLTGAGAVNATVAGGASTATITGAGAVTAAATQAVTATAAGSGAVAAAATQAVTASLAGAGSLSANGAITGTASLAGAGAVTGKAAQAAISAPAGAGALTAAAAQRAIAQLAAAGAVTAAGNTQSAFTVGTLTSATAPAATLTAASAAGGTAGGTITSSTQRTGGPS